MADEKNTKPHGEGSKPAPSSPSTGEPSTSGSGSDKVVGIPADKEQDPSRQPT